MARTPSSYPHVARQPRALFVTTVASTLEAFLLPLADALQDVGWSVDALAADARENPRLHAHFDHKFDIGWSRSPRSLLHYGRLARQLRALVTAEAYDVVHVHTPIAAFVARAALRHLTHLQTARPRLIYTVHGFHFYANAHARARLYRLIEHKALAWTDVLVVMNDEDERAAQTWLEHTSAKRRPRLKRIDGVGIDCSAYLPPQQTRIERQQLRERYALPMGSFTVGIIAEMTANKRHQLLFDAAALLSTRLPWLRVVCMGDGPLRSTLEQQVQTLGLQNTVIFTGQLSQSELCAVLSLCNLGILVSEREGLPRSLMEFSAAGVPIAGTFTRGIVDEVRDNRALAQATPEAIATLIETLAKSAPLRNELARAQHERVTTQYSLEHIIPAYVALYQETDELDF